MALNMGGSFEGSNCWINGYGWIAIALVIFANWNPAVCHPGHPGLRLLQHPSDLLRLVWPAPSPAALGWLATASPPSSIKALPFPDHRHCAGGHLHPQEGGQRTARRPGPELLPRGAVNGLFPPSAPCPIGDRALSVSRWGHRTLRGAIFSHCLRRGATSCARRSPTGRPYSARTGAIPSWGMPAEFNIHPRRQHKRGNRVSLTPPAPDAGAMPKARSRLPVSGGRGKADCGTQAERMWSRGPAGSVTLRRFAYFAAWGKVGRPAGRNPLEAETVGWKEDPSSVTAYAVHTFPPLGGRL